MKRRTVLRSLGLLGAAAAVSPGLAFAAAQTDAVSGLLAQSYPDLDGRPRAMSQWKGRPLLVNFWATWCAPCVKEMPELDALQKRHPRVQFIGLAVDSASNVVKFVSKVPVSYPVLITGPGSIDLMRRLGNGPGALPFTLVLAADGGIRTHMLGAVDIAKLDKILADVAA